MATGRIIQNASFLPRSLHLRRLIPFLLVRSGCQDAAAAIGDDTRRKIVQLLSGWNNPLGILVANSRAREESCRSHRAAAPRGPRSGGVTARRPAPGETQRR